MLDRSFSGITLTKEPIRETDARVSIYTREFGKITALAQGCQKTTSRLSAHLEPGRLIRGRIIEKSRMRIVDAITENSFPEIRKHDTGFARALAMLASVHTHTWEFEPDERLWEFCNQSLALLTAASAHRGETHFATLDLQINKRLQEVLGC